MRIYWYWPHPHRVASDLALSMLRPDDQLVVQALPSLHGDRFEEVDEYEVVRDLPDPTIVPAGPWPSLRRRVRITLGRSRARRRLLRRGFDVAHLQLLVHQTDWIELPDLSRRTSLVTTIHDVRPNRSFFPQPLERWVLGRMYERAGHLVVYHESLADELCAEFGLDGERVHVVPHPIDATAVRDALVAQPDRPLFLFFGTMRHNKGIDMLLDALTLLGSDLDADVLIVAHGAKASELRVRERAARLPNVEVELGFTTPERKRDLFARASCVVLPYTSFHSQSGVLIDAYAYRVPVVVSDVGAIGPTVRADRTGIVVHPGDPADLAAGLAEMAMARPGGYAGALEAAAQRHDARAVGPLLREVYQSAVDSRTASRR